MTTGIGRTAGVITSAAVVMVAVFALFATLPLVSLKELGVWAWQGRCCWTRRSSGRCCCRP
jgi:hypothetical protein